MNKTVVIHLGNGDLTQGFPNVIVRLWDDRHPRAEQFVGSLPASPGLVESYQVWQATYRALCDRQFIRSTVEAVEDQLEIEAGGITHVSQVSFQALSQQLQRQVNFWLQSEGFLSVERQLRSQLDTDAEIRVIFEVTDDLLRRLPWHCWHFFRDYAKAEVALSCPEYKRRDSSRSPSARKRVRILAILGNSQGINIEAERQMLQALPDADTHFLVAPSRQEFDRQLWDTLGWDILFFAGHSRTEGTTGRIYINENPVHNSLTIEQLEEALHTAIDNGLKLAIFNSCDGVGLAQALEALHIPQVIVMREPVPNQVAQEFFKCFLQAYATERLPLYQAVRQARRRLQGLEDEFPGASWLPVICQNPAIDPPTWLQLGGMPPCPYQGLFAFQEAEAHVFFGREQFTQTLVAAVQRKALVAVVGASGSGKSSVVFAGLVARLRSNTQRSLCLVSFRPGGSPFDALAEALTQELPEVTATQNPLLLENNQSIRFKTLELAVTLQQNSQALCKLIEELVQHNPGTHLLLIADQFEELYTLCAEASRQPFLESLLNAVQFAPAFTLVLTLRADFYGYALSDRRFSDLLQGAVYNLGPMSQEELQRAIVQPAAQMRVKLEEGLAEQLIQATWGHAGRLPLLEFALTQLWAKQQAGGLTHRAYAEIGGVEEAIATHAEGVYAQLAEGDRHCIQQILVQLVEPGVGIEPSRRLATRDEVGEANWNLVTRLASSRLVVTNRNEATGEETVEIVHEALLRSWGRLEQWIETDGEFRRWQEGLRIVRRQWESSGQDEEALLRGKLLTDAKYWYASRDEELSSRDREFIHLSLSAQAQENKRRKRRRKAIVSSLIAGLVAALMLAGLAWWGWQHAALSEVRAIRVSSDALFKSDLSFDALIEALRAERKLKTLAWSDAETRTGVELALRQATSRVVEQNRLTGHNGGVTAVAFSPDGQMIASASQDHTVKLWNRDGSLIRTLMHGDEVWGVAISPDGKQIASVSNDSTAKLWNREGVLLTTFKGHTGEMNAVAFSPDGQMIASASRDQTIRLWKLDGFHIAILKGHKDSINTVTFSPDGQTIASASADQTIKLWNREGTLLKTLNGHTDNVRGVAFSPDGRWIASASTDKTINLWQRDGTFLRTFRGHSQGIYSVKFSPDSQLLISASGDQTIKLWQLDGTLLKTLKGHGSEVVGIAFSPDGQLIASASLDNTVKFWQLQNPLLQILRGHKDEVRDVAFSPDGQLIASASDDRTVKLWSQEGALRKTLAGHHDKVYGIAFSPDSQTLASASRDYTIKLWNRDGVLRKTLEGQSDWVNRIAFSPDGQLIASANADQTLKLWKSTGVLQSTLNRHNGMVYGVAFSSDSQLIASTHNDKTINLWKRDGSFLRSLKGHSQAVKAVAFSPKDHLIASASDDGTVGIWKQNGALLYRFPAHPGGVRRVAFNPDGQHLASSGMDSTVKLWKREGRQFSLLAILNGYDIGVTGVAFSPDGQRLASANGNGTVALWNLQHGLDIDTLLKSGCAWIYDYLKTNSEINESDRHLCATSLH